MSASVFRTLLTFCVFIYVMVRLTFLLLPVVVAEHRIGIKRSWQLGKGNFWRMLGLFILIFLPIVVLEVVALKLFLPPVPMKCTDLAVKAGAEKLGVKVIHVRKATLSRPTKTRPACHFCGNCMSGCDVVAKYNSYDASVVFVGPGKFVAAWADANGNSYFKTYTCTGNPCSNDPNNAASWSGGATTDQ